MEAYAHDRVLDRSWRTRIPFLREHPTFRRLDGRSGRRVLILLAPTGADLPAVRKLGRELRRRGVDAVATTECHGEVRGEHDEQLFPNLLLIEAAGQRWDAVVVAGGSGAARVAEDQLARQVVSAIAQSGQPVAALGLGRLVLERAGIRGLLMDDAAALADWLAGQPGAPPPTEQATPVQAPT
jgi:hypothetical protein